MDPYRSLEHASNCVAARQSTSPSRPDGGFFTPESEARTTHRPGSVVVVVVVAVVLLASPVESTHAQVQV